MLIYLPSGEHGEKVGADDFLAAGRSVDDMLAYATPELRALVRADDDNATYREINGNLVWMKPTQNGAVATRLTNFTARIEADVCEDDGAEQRRVLELVAQLGARNRRFRVSASQFNSMSWPVEQLGAGAIVLPGFGLRDHARAAIQMLSGDVLERRVFTHTGWREIDGERLYLSGTGAIGDAGARDDVAVELSGALANYRLPESPGRETLIPAIKTSIRLFELGPMSVTAPLLGATYLAPLREALVGCPYDLVVWFWGQTGKFKTEAVVLAQAHYGPFSRMTLPVTFTATANAVERALFAAKDALVVVDDYHPAADRREEQAMNGVASRLLRGVGNGSGRQRMRADTTLRPDLPPRALPMATGERLPAGQSTNARMFPVAVEPGAIDASRLAIAQSDAALLPIALSGYISWLAPRLTDLSMTLPQRFRELRSRASAGSVHAREPGQIAHLQIGVETLLRFAVDSGVLTDEDAARIEAQAWEALNSSSVDRRTELAGEAPAERFVSLVTDIFASKRAYLEGPRGDRPGDAGSWGWEHHGRLDRNGNEQAEWRHAVAPMLGRVDEEYLYLLPEATFQAVGDAARLANSTFPVDLTTLVRRLAEAGYSVTEQEGARLRRTVKHRFGSQTIRVIKLRRAALSPGDDGEHGEHGEPTSVVDSIHRDSGAPDVPHVPRVPHAADVRGDEHEVCVI